MTHGASAEIAHRGLESSVSVAQQNRDIAAKEIGDCEIELAVSVQVRERNRRGLLSSGRILDYRLKRSVPISKKTPTLLVS